MRHLFLVGAALMMVFFAACSKDNDEAYDPTPQFNKDVDSIKAYLKSHSLTAIQDTVSGIFYKIAAIGNGIDSVKYTNTKVKTLYSGKLLSDIVFDSTTGTTAREFYAGQVITGWQFALTKITKGGKIRVYLPSYYGYGRQAQAGIPANSPLIFDIELVDVTNPQQ
jgi:FKBP-type peptidyl-prolyl cis-trans isomerase